MRVTYGEPGLSVRLADKRLRRARTVAGMLTVAFQSERGTPPLTITDGGDEAGTRRARSRRYAR